MAAVSTIIAGIGLAIGAGGAFLNFQADKKAAKESKKAEKLREQQMNLDAMRKRREVIRQMIVAKATGASNAAVQGVSGGDSAVVGGQAQAVATAARNTSAINQSQSIGQGIFDANAGIAAAQRTGAWGQAFQSVGGGLIENSETISRVGATAGLWKSDT